MLVAVFKEEREGKKIDSGIFLVSLSLPALFVSYLVLGVEPGKRGGKKKTLQSSKEQLQSRRMLVLPGRELVPSLAAETISPSLEFTPTMRQQHMGHSTQVTLGP